jgi:hypothetical protein
MIVLAVVTVPVLPRVANAMIERSGSGKVETIECRGQSVELEGTSNSFTLLGECPSVEVSGTGNVVKIEQVGRIEVTGVSNKVIWTRSLRGSRPKIEKTGLENSVQQGTFKESGHQAEEPVAAPSGTGGSPTVDSGMAGAGSTGSTPSHSPSRSSGAGRTIVLDLDHETKTVDCQGEDVEVNGNHSKVTVTGECHAVSVNGNYNKVQIEAAAVISAVGNRNTVSWQRGVDGQDPRVSNLGTRNTVARSAE